LITIFLAAAVLARAEVAVAPKLITASRLSLGPKVLMSEDHLVLGASLAITLNPGSDANNGDLFTPGFGSSLGLDIVPSGTGFDGVYIGGRFDWAITSEHASITGFMGDRHRLNGGIMVGKRWIEEDLVVGIGGGLKMGDHYGALVFSRATNFTDSPHLVPMPVLELTIAYRLP
jgi:hypothetical protein